MSTIKEVAAERCKDSPWFDLNNELVILPAKVRDDDDPLLEDADFLRLAKAKGIGFAYPELPKISLPCDYRSVEDEFQFPTRFINRIGQSGWNYKTKEVGHVCFDFDLADDHTTTGVSAADLALIMEALSQISCCEVRLSTSGRGLHVYVKLASSVPAETRQEYTQTIDRVLTLLDELHALPFSLRSKVDTTAAGRGVLWLWTPTPNASSFKLISAATKTLSLGDWEPTAQTSQQAATGLRAGYDLNGFVSRYVSTYQPKNYARADNGKAFLVECPFHKHEGDMSKTMIWAQTGVPCFHCFADKCQTKRWRDYANKVAPEEAALASDVHRIIYLGDSEDEFFHDANGNPFVTYCHNGPQSTIPLTADYGNVLRIRFQAATGAIASKDSVSVALEQLKAIAMLERPEYPVYIRVGMLDGRYYLDLADGSGRAVELTQQGWEVVNAPKGLRFYRPDSLRPLPVPERGGSIELLRKYVRTSEEDWPLIPAWLVGAMRPDAPCAPLAFIAPAGSGKTNQLEFCFATINPTAAPEPKESSLAGVPKSVDDLFVTAYRSWTTGLDNVSEIGQDLSDTLSRIVTGGTRETRKLFTDSDISVLTVRRPIGLTSTAHCVQASDLADRALIVDVPPMTERKAEEDLWRAFAADRPKVLGALCDAFVTALRNRASVQLGNDPPRMMDFAKWAQAAESSFGFTAGTTVAAMKQRQRGIADDAVAESKLASALRDFATNEGWQGSALELLTQLGPSDGWSTSPRRFRTELNRVIPDLKKIGVVLASTPSGNNTVWSIYERLAA